MTPLFPHLYYRWDCHGYLKFKLDVNKNWENNLSSQKNMDNTETIIPLSKTPQKTMFGLLTHKSAVCLSLSTASSSAPFCSNSSKHVALPAIAACKLTRFVSQSSLL